MPGRFEGLTDEQWALFESIFPEQKPTRGYPKTPPRKVLNALLYILITGCRWCDLPKGEQWASKSAGHRWLKRWGEDGTLELVKERILGIAELRDMIDWESGAVDGSFSPWERRGARRGTGLQG